MSIKTSRSSRDKKPDVALEIRPGKVQQGGTVLVSGSGWPLDAIVFKIGKETLKPDRILNGSIWNGLLVPDPAGSFLVVVSTQNQEPGRYTLRAESVEGGIGEEREFLVEKRISWGPDVPRAKLDKPYMRGAAFKKLRTGERTGWPEGFASVAKKDWVRIHEEAWRRYHPDSSIFYIAPVHGACNWVPLGPAPFSVGKGWRGGNNSGRIRCIAIDPITPARMYIGTAGGGVWKSEDGGGSWAPTSDDAFSLAIGALAIDPVYTNVVYAGTGEMIPGADFNNYHGRGILQSTTYGNSWTEIGVTEFALEEIARIVVNPQDTANLFVAASNGLWERASSGSPWTRLSPNPCTDVVLVQDPAESGTRRLIAGFSTLGIFRAENSGSGWGTTFDPVPVSGAPADPLRIVFGVCRTQPRHIYAAFSNGAGSTLAHVSRSEDWGATWTPCTIPVASSTDRIYNAHYNLAILPHPTDPGTVILAVVDVFRSTDGGDSWSNVSVGGGTRVHVDCHAIAFHPRLPDSLFVTCDGGLFFSPDVCATWQARNLDISTIQFYELSQHPRYDAIMIGGSLDNGGFHYSGAPIWLQKWVPPGVSHNPMAGDVVVAAIDPFDPYYHYYGTGIPPETLRSDDGGRFFTHYWASFPGTEWWIPFYPDPRTGNEGVVYTGGNQLMRSENRGTDWNPATPALASPIRAIGFHPANPQVLYIGTVGGQVYRVTGPATGPWDPSTSVVMDDVTFTGLPPEKGISGLAVDPSGNVWASISDLIHAEGTGEFTNNHVFRLDDGALSWSLKSERLAVANPINTIVIDPRNPDRVFCGGDRGVFVWDAAHQRWNPMDEGLPNSPVFKLLIHDPSRKIRAATHGRGAWERSLDALSCPDHFLYFRDNLTDSGTIPSLDGVPHPYIRGELCWHWQSEDIIVDPSIQTPSVVTTPTELYDKIVHLGARRGANRVYVTVHNKGPFAVTGVLIRAFFAGAVGGILPEFPPGMLADPFSWNPRPGTTSPWNPVSTAAFPIGPIEPGTTRLAYWEFGILPDAERHSCIMAFATSEEDPFSSGGITDPDQLVVQNRKVTLKNLDLDVMPLPPGGGGGDDSGSTGGDSRLSPEGSTAPRELMMHGRDESGRLFNAVITCGNMPADAVIVVAVDKENRKELQVEEVKLSENASAVKQEFAKFPNHPKDLYRYDLKNLIVCDAASGEKIPIGDVVIRKGKPMGLVIWVHSWKWDQNERYSFDIVQMGENKAAGGFTVRIVDPKSSEGLRTMDSQGR